MKNDYTRCYFWEKKNQDYKTEYFFKYRGNFVQVKKEIYYLCKNSYRKINRDISLDFMNTINYHDNQDKLGLNIDPLNEIILKDLKTILNKAIQYLTPEERYIIYGLYFEGKTQIQISYELNLPEYTVSRKKKRALQKLKKELVKLQDINQWLSFFK